MDLEETFKFISSFWFFKECDGSSSSYLQGLIDNFQKKTKLVRLDYSTKIGITQSRTVVVLWPDTRAATGSKPNTGHADVVSKIPHRTTEMHYLAFTSYTDLAHDFWLSQSVCQSVVQVDKLHIVT